MNSLPYRVLIVEDEDAVLELIKTAFDSEKNHLFTAGTLEKAEHLLKLHGADLLLLDRMLPDGDGLQLARNSGTLPNSKPCRYSSLPGERTCRTKSWAST